jgi:RIP metalloprotease RseP
MQLLYVLFVLFFFGLCIFVHEFGHLLAALRCGLHVERFSIGFGKKIWGFTRNGVEYIVSWLPFGGYVALPQLEPVETPKAEDGRELPAAKPMARIITAFAGPFANLIFGFFLAAIITIIGVHRTAPQTGWVVDTVPQIAEPTSSEIGMKHGDTVSSINNTPVRGNWEKIWESMTVADLEKRGGVVSVVVERKPYCFGQFGKPVAVELKVKPKVNPEYMAGLTQGDRIVKINGQTFEMTYEKMVHALTLDDNEVRLTVERNGSLTDLTPYKPAKNPKIYDLPFPFMDFDHDFLIGAIDPGSPAAKAGLRKEDRILVVNQKQVLGMLQFNRLVSASQGQPIALTIERPELDKNGDIVKGGKVEILTLSNIETLPRYIIGVAVKPGIEGQAPSCIVQSVNPESPAAKAGLMENDQIKLVNGVAIKDRNDLNQQIRLAASAGKPINLGIRRHGSDIQANGLQVTQMKNEEQVPVFEIGAYPKEIRVLHHPNPWWQFTDVLGRTTQTLKALVAGRVRPKDFSGPVGILQMTYMKVTIDQFRGGLSFIVLISFSLAFFNLLPLPVLDGGHITFAAIEMIFNRRLPIKILEWLYTAFAVMLISFMLYVTLYDIGRIADFLGFSKRINATPPAIETVVPEKTDATPKPPAAPAPAAVPAPAPAI